MFYSVKEKLIQYAGDPASVYLFKTNTSQYLCKNIGKSHSILSIIN